MHFVLYKRNFLSKWYGRCWLLNVKQIWINQSRCRSTSWIAFRWNKYYSQAFSEQKSDLFRLFVWNMPALRLQLHLNQAIQTIFAMNLMLVLFIPIAFFMYVWGMRLKFSKIVLSAYETFLVDKFDIAPIWIQTDFQFVLNK